MESTAPGAESALGRGGARRRQGGGDGGGGPSRRTVLPRLLRLLLQMRTGATLRRWTSLRWTLLTPGRTATRTRTLDRAGTRTSPRPTRKTKIARPTTLRSTSCRQTLVLLKVEVKCKPSEVPLQQSKGQWTRPTLGALPPLLPVIFQGKPESQTALPST